MFSLDVFKRKVKRLLFVEPIKDELQEASKSSLFFTVRNKIIFCNLNKSRTLIGSFAT